MRLCNKLTTNYLIASEGLGSKIHQTKIHQTSFEMIHWGSKWENSELRELRNHTESAGTNGTLCGVIVPHSKTFQENSCIFSKFYFSKSLSSRCEMRLRI